MSRTPVTVERVNVVLRLPTKFQKIVAHLNDETLYPSDEVVDWILDSTDKFANSLRHGLITWGSLTDRQRAAAVKSAAKLEELKLADAEVANTLPWPPTPGAQQLTLRIKSHKVAYAGAARAIPVLKMVGDVLMPEARKGARVWMTIPQAVRDAAEEWGTELNDCVFSCEVTITRSPDDQHFAFGSRPRNVVPIAPTSVAP